MRPLEESDPLARKILVLSCTAAGASGFVVGVGASRAIQCQILYLGILVVLEIITSKSRGVTLSKAADTTIFGVIQRDDYFLLFFKRDIWRIRELRSKLGVSFFLRVAKVLSNLVGFGQNKIYYGNAITGRKCTFGAKNLAFLGDR